MSTTRPLALVLLLAAAGDAGAANFRLSEAQPWSDVYVSAAPDPLVSPDGRWLFYRHDADVDEAVELWRVPAVGGTPERISGLLPSGSNVFGVELTPDGSRVVFNSPQDDVDVHELFSAPVDAPAGSYDKINAPLPQSMVADFRGGYSPDSERLLYASNHPYDAPIAGTSAQLWVARVDGSDRTSIVTLPAERRFDDFRPTPDFARAVYIADATVADRMELWSVPISGGTPAQLSGALVADGDVLGFAISPADGSVIYWADQQVDGRTELYRVPAAGGGAVKISHALGVGRFVTAALFTPDGSRVVYGEQSDPPGFTEVWSIAPDGAGRVGLVGALVPGGSVVAIVTDARGTGLPAAGRLVFVADKQTDEVFELYSSDLVTGAQVKLNPALALNGDVVSGSTADQPKVTPDGSTVVYAADPVTNGVENLYRVPIGGGASTAIGGATTFGSSTIQGFVLSPDGSRVARVRRYRILPTSAWSTHLASASLSAGGWQQVDSCPVEVCDLAVDPAFSPTDPKTIFYVADQEADERFDLYAGDTCLLCDGFEVGTTVRWSLVVP
jgi:Tol biopolymer transport system component